MIFRGDKACREVSLINHPVDATKKVTKSEENKLTNSIKFDLPSCPLIPLIFITRTKGFKSWPERYLEPFRAIESNQGVYYHIVPQCGHF